MYTTITLNTNTISKVSTRMYPRYMVKEETVVSIERTEFKELLHNGCIFGLQDAFGKLLPQQENT